MPKNSFPLPPIEDFKVDTSIRILAQGSYFEFDVRDNKIGLNRPFFVKLTHNDVEEINKKLKVALENNSQIFQSNTYTTKDSQNALYKIAEIGKFAFNVIFKKEKDRETIKKSLTNARIVQIVSDELMLPWELLFDGELKENINIQGFWGMRHLIFLGFTENQDSLSWSTEIFAKLFRIGLVVNTELDAVKNVEIPALKKLHLENKIFLKALEELDANANSNIELKKFIKFMENEREIFHFACHSLANPKLISDTHFVIDKNFVVSMNDARTYEFNLAGSPYVILNACKTGLISSLQSFQWASFFCEKGARGAIATVIDIPDIFAASFIKEFYFRILNGENVGNSLFKTREYFGAKGNPLGLAYTMYHSPEIRFIKK